MVCSEANQYR